MSRQSIALLRNGDSYGIKIEVLAHKMSLRLPHWVLRFSIGSCVTERLDRKVSSHQGMLAANERVT
jgi:hypothetical protein